MSRSGGLRRRCGAQPNRPRSPPPCARCTSASGSIRRRRGRRPRRCCAGSVGVRSFRASTASWTSSTGARSSHSCRSGCTMRDQNPRSCRASAGPRGRGVRRNPERHRPRRRPTCPCRRSRPVREPDVGFRADDGDRKNGSGDGRGVRPGHVPAERARWRPRDDEAEDRGVLRRGPLRSLRLPRGRARASR